MREIAVSTEVFAAIWSRRKDGEDSENAILERVLDVKATKPGRMLKTPLNDVQIPPPGGFFVPEFRVYFPEGQEIFRIYKGQRYSAAAENGRWHMNGKYYPSLHKLSMAIVKGRENSWNNWKFLDGLGRVTVIDVLRKIGRQ